MRLPAPLIAKAIAGLGVLALTGLLTSCGGGGSDGSGDGSAPDRNITGGATKGPLRGAAIKVFPLTGPNLDTLGPELTSSATTTNSSGNFSVSVPPGHFFIQSSGGSYVDEADPAAVKRSITLAPGTSFSSPLPQGANTIALNIASVALADAAIEDHADKKLICTNLRFPSVFDALRARAQNAVGFDIVTTIPPDPTAPSGTTAQRQYGMLLGGLAQTVNEVATRLGRAQPDDCVLAAVENDFIDGLIDSSQDGSPITVGVLPSCTGGAPMPSGLLTLNEQINRFRNNNAAVYSATPLLVINESALAAELNIGPVPDAFTQSFSIFTGGGTPVDFVDGCDTEGDAITGVQVLDPPDHASTFTTEADHFGYVHNGDGATSDSFTYALQDAQGNVGEPVVVNISIAPGNTDSDEDGLTAAQEAALGTNPNSSDSDGDGFSDFVEVNQDGNPNDFNSGAGDTDPNLASSFPGCIAAPANLIAWYPGDGNANDIAGTNHGTLQNGAAFATGKVDQAFSFDGVNQYVEIQDSPALRPTSVTLDAWVNFNTTSPGIRIIVAKGAGNGTPESYGLWFDPAGLLVGAIGSPTTPFPDVSAPFNPVPGTWYHVAYTFDDGLNTQSLYLDGNLVASNSNTNSIGYDATPVTIGSEFESGVPDLFFDGLIDEVEIFDRALAQSEVQAIFNAGAQGKCKPQCLGPVTTDVWDAAQGATVNFDSGMNASGSQASDMFGTTLSPVEPGNAVFADGEADGFEHFVEWSTPDPVRVTRINVFAQADTPGNTDRTFSEFRLLAGIDGFLEIYRRSITVPYSATGELRLCINIPPTTVRNWRAEFVQNGAPADSGPRIVELDAIGTIELDLDDDGLTTFEESEFGTNPNNPDTDGDGFEDGNEFSRGTSGTDPDTDNDDVNDFLDSRLFGDPLTADIGRVLHVRPMADGGNDSNDGLSWGAAKASVVGVNAWLSTRPSQDIYYVLFAQNSGNEYGAPLSIGASVPASSVVVVIGGLDPNAPASQQGLFQPFGSVLDGGADCSLPTPGGTGPVVAVAQPQLLNLGLFGLNIKNGSVTGANNGGGIQTTASVGAPVLVLDDSKVESSCSENFGGGIYVADWRLQLHNSEINANKAVNGGGIYGAPFSRIEIFDSAIDGNRAYQHGGGLASAQDGRVTISGGKFRQNAVYSGASGPCAGGALHQEGNPGDDLFIEDSLFAANHVFCDISPVGDTGGGAIFAEGLGTTSTGFSATIQNSRFLSNQCIGDAACTGGAVSLRTLFSGLTNNLFVGNIAADRGGALSMQGNNGGYLLRVNTLAYNQALGTGDGRGGGIYTFLNALHSSFDNIAFFNDNGIVAPTHDVGEDCKADVSATTLLLSTNDTLGSHACTDPGTTGTLSSDPAFEAGFYLNQLLSAAVNSGSEPDAENFFCTLASCPPGADFTTNPTGARDIGVLDRGYHYLLPAEAAPDGAAAAPGQNNNVAPDCGLSYSFNLTTAGGSGPDLTEAHLVAVCLTSAAQAANFKLTGQGTLDPVNNDGTATAPCVEPAVLATDSGVNGVYSISLDGETTGAAGGPHNVGVAVIVDGGAPITHTITGATFGGLCGTS